jgi:hypothetical protein
VKHFGLNHPVESPGFSTLNLRSHDHRGSVFAFAQMMDQFVKRSVSSWVTADIKRTSNTPIAGRKKASLGPFACTLWSWRKV